jgi:hypothetical protein
MIYKTGRPIRLNSTALITLLFWISGCVSGPKQPDQTFAQKLNADSYESSNTVMGVPVLTRKPIQRKVSGKIMCGEGLSQRPANHATVSLNDGDIVVASASSNSDGTYTILASILIEKPYQLRVSSKCGNSIKEISLKDDSSFDINLNK